METKELRPARQLLFFPLDFGFHGDVLKDRYILGCCPCSMTEIDWNFRGAYCLHHTVDESSWVLIALTMEAVISYEMPDYNGNIPENSSFLLTRDTVQKTDGMARYLGNDDKPSVKILCLPYLLCLSDYFSSAKCQTALPADLLCSHENWRWWFLT